MYNNLTVKNEIKVTHLLFSGGSRIQGGLLCYINEGTQNSNELESNKQTTKKNGSAFKTFHCSF